MFTIITLINPYNMNIKQAKETTVFLPLEEINYSIVPARNQDNRFILLDSKGFDVVGEHMDEAELIQTLADTLSHEVEETTLYDYVMEHQEETTTPLGVGPVLSIRQNIENNCYEVFSWGHCGQFPKALEEFYSKEEAQEYLFNKLYNEMKENDPEPINESELDNYLLEQATDFFNSQKPMYYIVDNTSNTGKIYINADTYDNTGNMEGALRFFSEKEAETFIKSNGWDWAGISIY